MVWRPRFSSGGDAQRQFDLCTVSNDFRRDTVLIKAAARRFLSRLGRRRGGSGSGDGARALMAPRSDAFAQMSCARSKLCSEAVPRRTAWPMSSSTDVGEFNASWIALRRSSGERNLWGNHVYECRCQYPGWIPHRPVHGAQRLTAAHGQIGETRLARIRFALGSAHALEGVHRFLEAGHRVAPPRAWCGFHQAVCRQHVMADVPQMP